MTARRERAYYTKEAVPLTFYLQQLLNGLSLGGMYALMAVGYSLVYSIMNFSNFAHGGVIMIGAYIGFFCMESLGVPFLAAFAICGVGCGVLAVIIERLVYRPLRTRNAPSLYFIISAMGASIFLENIVIATIGPTFRSYPQSFTNQVFDLGGGLSLGMSSLLMLGVSTLALLALMLILNKTKVGLAIRASSYNIRASTLMGVNVNVVVFAVFLMGGILAGFAGMLFGMKYTVYPSIGNITTKSFIAAVFGGLGSLPGAVVGSVLLGILEIIVASYNSALRDLFVFALLVVVLVLKPSGLMGKVTEDKA